MEDILNIKMPENDAAAKTIKDYLIALLLTLIKDQDSFSGKRPFGNSDWIHDFAYPLIKAGKLKGNIDEDGYAENYNDNELEKLLIKAIKKL